MNIWPEIHHGGKRVPCAAAAGKKEEEMIDGTRITVKND